MLRFTLIYSVSDGNPLCETVDEGDKEAGKVLQECKSDAVAIIHSLKNPSSRPLDPRDELLGTGGDPSLLRGSVETGRGFVLHYLVQNATAFVACADSNFKRDLAFHFLHAVSDGFAAAAGEGGVDGLRPYQYISVYGPGLGKLQDRYNRDAAASAPENKARIDEMHALNAELSEVSHIMSQNIEDVLLRGDKLDTVYERSSRLRSSSSKFVKQTKYLNWLAKWRTYGPFAVVALLVLAFLYLRFFYF